MASAASNVTFASPLADAKYAKILGSPQIDGFIQTLSQTSGWTIALTIFLGLVAYDQCKDPFPQHALDFINKVVVSYIWQKGSIVGPTWKLPFMGPFLESVNPKFGEYKAKWASGELSCVSVFHK